MLVLTRKKGQSLNVGNRIKIIVVDITGDSVRIGIEAPPEIAIYRSEIYQSLQQENRESMANKKILSELGAINKTSFEKKD